MDAAAAARVVVLGAGGFVGGAVLRALAARPGPAPIAGLRRPAGVPAGVETRLVDARDQTSVARAMAGAGAVVNCVLGDAATMLAATRNACAAAAGEGRGTRVVHVSTMSVYGDATGVVAEDTPLSANSPYGATKIACEAIIRDFVAAGGEAVIVRPGIVYGPGGEQWVGRVARLLRARRLGDLGALGDGICNLIHNDDLAAAITIACAAAAAGGEAINLAEPEPPTWNQYFRALGRAIGAVPIRTITTRALRAETKLLAVPLQLAKLAGQRGGLRPGALPEPIPPSLPRLFQQRIWLDPAKADRLLGFPRTPTEDGIAQCAAWLGRAGLDADGPAITATRITTDAAA